jgi:plasmid stability protein
MRRTNIYLTEAQEAALRVRADARGTTKSAVLREILDRDLAIDVDDEGVDQELAELAEGYHDHVGEFFDDDPDLRIDR